MVVKVQLWLLRYNCGYQEDKHSVIEATGFLS